MLLASMLAIDGKGDLPSKPQLDAAKHLREVANDLFQVAIKEMAESAAKLRLYPGLGFLWKD